MNPDLSSVTSLPDVFLGYQKRLMAATAQYPVVLCEKSRRIGVTWGIAADAVLTAAANKSARGMDVFYIGFNLDMTKEFIDTCAEWAKSFHHAAAEVDQFMFNDIDENGHTKEIQAFRIKFDSGFSINALTSRPRSLRGRQGYIIIDEAAFHDDLKELMKAALAMLIWGGKVLVISTHDGVNNPFNEYIQDARSGRNKYHVMRIDFDDALKDGLYKRICLTTDKEWTAAGEAEWRQEIVDFYGDGADEELFCVPRLSAGAFLISALVESRMDAIPVIRWSLPDDFVFLPEIQRERQVRDLCERDLAPILKTIDPICRTYIGGDFARSGDLSVYMPLAVDQKLVRRPPFLLELRNFPFAQQRQILWYIIDRLVRFCAGAFDARGLGQQISEETMQRYGGDRIRMVMTSAAWYMDALPKYKAGLEDAIMILPRDADVLNDHRVARMINGIAQIPDARTKGSDGGKRHGDTLIAAAMAYWSTLQEFTEYDYETPSRLSGAGPSSRDRSDGVQSLRQHFGNNKGAY